MDMMAQLDEIVASVETAKSMPMSASCIVNRGDLLAALDELREALPAEVTRARAVLQERDAVLADARAAAAEIVAAAEVEREQRLADTDIVAQAEATARARVEAADAEAARMRVEVEEYIDAKLASFEVLLARTLRAVQRGRSRLAGEPEGLLGAPEEADVVLPE